MSFGIRSGLNDTITQRHEFFDHMDYAKELEKLCPNPNPRIVESLTEAWERGFELSTYLLPWKRNEKYKDGYDPNNVLFYARILTLLDEMGIHPPPKMQLAGFGKGLPGLSLVGPEVYTFVPEGNPSHSGLNLPTTEDEAKAVVNSSEYGGLADGARGQMEVLRDRSNPSVKLLLRALVRQARRLVIWSGVVKDPTAKHKKNDDANIPPDVEEDFFDGDDEEDVKQPDEIKRELYFAPPIPKGNRDANGNPIFTIDDVEEIELAELPQDSFIEMDPGPFDGSDEISNRLVHAMELDSGEFGDLDEGDDVLREAARRSSHPYIRSITRRLDQAAMQLRRRLPWSRLNREQRARVEDLLPPAMRGSFEDDEIVLWEAEPAVSWWRRLGPRRSRSRISWLQLIMWRFLLPVSLLISGIALYYREKEGEQEDPLITLYRALPDTNWFKQSLDLFTWAKLVPMTPRQDNFVLLNQVGNPELLHYAADMSFLWKTSYLSHSPDLEYCLQYFNAFKSDMTYRSKYNSELTRLVKNKGMWDFAMIYVAQLTHPRGLALMTAFFDSGLPPTQELIEQEKNVNTPIVLEQQTSKRELKFEALLDAFANAIKYTKDFRTPWMRDMMDLYHKSKFNYTLDQLAFTNVLRELEINPSPYQDDAKSVVSDFLRRYTTKDGDMSNTIPFQQNLHSLKYDQDIFAPVKQLLQAMSSYRNDGQMDALAYEFLNKKWAQHNAQTPYPTFEDAMASFELSDKHKVAVQAAVESMERGLMPFVDTVRHELQTKPAEDDGFPAELVGLHKAQPDELALVPFQINSNVPFADNSRALVPLDNAPIPVVAPSGRSVGSGNKVMAVVPAWVDYKKVLFFRVKDTVVLKLGDVPVVMAVNDGNMQIAAFPAPDHEEAPQVMEVWQKPVEQSNSGGLVLANRTWFRDIAELVFLVGMAIMAVFMVAQRNHVGPERMAVTLGKVATVSVGGAKMLATRFVAVPFKQQLLITAASVTTTAVVVYRKDIANVTTDVSKRVGQLVAIAVGVSLLSTARDVYIASQRGQKRKL